MLFCLHTRLHALNPAIIAATALTWECASREEPSLPHPTDAFDALAYNLVELAKDIAFCHPGEESIRVVDALCSYADAILRFGRCARSGSGFLTARALTIRDLDDELALAGDEYFNQPGTSNS